MHHVAESRLWRRFRAWADRLDRRAFQQDWRPAGIELVADDAIREQIQSEARKRRMWTLPPVVVRDDEFMTQGEAAECLRSRAAPMPNVGILIARGILQQAFAASDGSEGVTRMSVEDEMRWRRTASPWRKVTRRIGGVLHWV
jgi:hypothetical protein